MLLFLLISVQIVLSENSRASNLNQTETDVKKDSVIMQESQNKDYFVDSLTQILKFENVDTNRIKIYRKIILYYNYKDPVKALPYADTLILLAEKLNEIKFLKKAYLDIGTTYYYLSNTIKSTEYFIKNLSLCEEEKDSLGISKALNNIGTAYHTGGAYDKALEYFILSLDMKIKLSQTENLWTSYGNIAMLYADLEKYDEALKNFKLAIEAWKMIKSDNMGNYASLLNEIARLYLSQNKLDSAEVYLEEAMDYINNTKSTYTVANILMNTSYLNRQNGKIDQAEHFINMAIEIAIKSNLSDLLAIMYGEKSIIEEQKGDYKLSLELFKKYKFLDDSINHQQNLDEMYQIKENYLVEKQEAKSKLLMNEIELNKAKLQRKNIQVFSFIAILLLMIGLAMQLVKNNIKRKKTNVLLREQHEVISNYNEELVTKQEIIEQKAKQLEDTNKDLVLLSTQKDKFYSIISHDLKGSIGAVEGFSTLLIDKYDNLTEEKKKKFATLISKGAKSTMDLLNNLLEWSRSQQDKIVFNPEKINLHEMVSSVMYFTAPISDKKEIETINQIEENEFAIGDQGMIFTILRNLISNAIKFTPIGGKINVFSENVGNNYIIHVKDTGIGISEDVQSSLFNKEEVYSTPGTEKESGTGLGLMLCKEFVRKHNQKIGMNSIEGEGSDFWFTLKVSK